MKRNVGNTAFHFHLGRIIDSLGTILFALNERYDPATKRVEEVYTNLAVVPYCFLKKYNRILETPLTSQGRKDILKDLEALVHETENLIE